MAPAGCLGGAGRGGGGGAVGFVCPGTVDQVRVGGPESRVGLGCEGRLAWPCCGPIAKVSRGPCGFPTLMLWPSWMSMTGIR
ncbi:hypothetical protein BST25_16550 [Mycobacterium heidelbergense]|uniref:Uncharacterized protein n=1 Tax=Mycobacterium heidelbergense TaxID=53376 RepID=A0A1X0DGQ0_MYCHE|nr:hypothetical protein BST25_16550 [Mycobacterium heidelbergense]